MSGRSGLSKRSLEAISFDVQVQIDGFELNLSP